ncbi:hypothetical protein JCM10207_003930 [Rhodosporidiobolus poonsookiae]
MAKDLDDGAGEKDGMGRRPSRPRRHSSLVPSLGGGASSPLASRRGTMDEKHAGDHLGNGDAFVSPTSPSPSSPEDGLPLPAVAFIPPDATSKFRVQWAKLKRRIGNGSAPSESLGDPTTTTESDGGSSFGHSGPRKNGLGPGEKENAEPEEVDEVVVEQTNDYDCWKRTTIPSNSASNRGAGGTGTTPGTTTGPIGTMPSDASSLRPTAYEANGPVDAVVGFARYRLWPMLSRFFAPSYHDPAVEEAYQKEVWYNSKSMHIFGAMFFTLNWVLSIALLPKPWSTWNKVQLYGLGPAFSVPLVVFAAFDLPRRQPWTWQLILFASVWLVSAANPIDMYKCGYYTPTPHCGTKDFQMTFYYVAFAPVVALFAMGQKRILTVVYSLTWLILVASTVLPQRTAFVRNVINALVFHGFVIWMHQMRETSDRRMYTMRAELKISYRAKQRAQINERKMMDAKRRFSSYIFHEVRVPLNTALLALQNIKADGAFNESSDHAIEYAALQGSLEMMSQVLNDVLDFSRMERGGFRSVSRPFSVHDVMRSVFAPLRLDTAARGLQLETYLDPRIDKLAVEAAWPKMLVSDVGEGDGRVMGDEMRLRQVLGNLVSNACKFTPSGGKITIRTSLIYPLEEYNTPQHLPTAAELAGEEDTAAFSDNTEATYSPRLSANRLQAHDHAISPQPKEMMVVRFEVTDTGVGIRSSDAAEAKLFSPYVQTAVGREQGGKGTGLGLSLCRQILLLTGGRLGVRSKAGEGSTFWFEWPFAIGPQTKAGSEEAPFKHRRAGTEGGMTMVEKDKDGGYGGITPMTDSTASDYRFVASLRKRSSDPTLDSIDESSVRPRDSSVSTQLSSPLGNHLSPPTSPGLSEGPPSPVVHISGPSPPPQSRATSQLTALPPPHSPPVFGHPFSLVPPHRPENRSHVSSVSAPAEVTVPPHLATSPVVSPTATPAAQSQSRSAGGSSTALEFADGPLRVLVVDDDTLTRRLMGRMMQRLGCIVSSAENGKIALDMILAPPPTPDADSIEEDEDATVEGVPIRDAVDAAEKGLIAAKKKRKVGMDPTAGPNAYKHYDIVFLDNQMPVCSGVQVVAKLRSLARDDLVVGVTANALLSDQEQYLESGASYILTKPVKETDLKKYLIVADKRRSENKDPVLRQQRQATLLSGPQFPPPPSIHGLDGEDEE